MCGLITGSSINFYNWVPLVFLSVLMPSSYKFCPALKETRAGAQGRAGTLEAETEAESTEE